MDAMKQPSEGRIVSVVDDDASIRRSTERLIRSFGFQSRTFGSAEELLDSGRAADTGCLILDVRMPGMGGLELQQRLVENNPRIPIVFLTGRASDEEERRALDAGAVDILRKPISAEVLRRVLSTVFQSTVGDASLGDAVDRSILGEIVGTSPALREVLSRVSKVAPTDATVLISGETGTGKELVARAVHAGSRRSMRPFVAVNCAAFPASLISSELFGHEKGAFTDALERRVGRFEAAHGGTLFLDEVGELPPDAQVALLRVLQEHEFERVGGTRSIRVDVRVIAATNRDLSAAIAVGTFRSDLFYRLNVFPIAVPPLRERPEDIAPLVDSFVRRYASQTGKTLRGIDPRTADALRAYDWPGNIRELQNVIERSVVLCDSDTFAVDESWLYRDSRRVRPASQPLADELARQERAMIETALAEAKGRVAGPAGAAIKLGLPASTLDSKIRTLGIRKERFRGLT